MPQVTARNVSEVRCWIETTAHHIASKEEEGFMVLKGHCGDKLRVPLTIWERCFIKAGDNMDKRMFRWNHCKEFEYLSQQRQQEKMPKTPG